MGFEGGRRFKVLSYEVCVVKNCRIGVRYLVGVCCDGHWDRCVVQRRAFRFFVYDLVLKSWDCWNVT